HVTEVLTRFRHTLATGEQYVAAETLPQRPDRQPAGYYEWQINRIPLPDGGYGVVCYFRDVSPQVLARLDLETADRQKNEFLAMLAHELRNPLAPIRNASELLARAHSTDPGTSAAVAV